MVVTGGFYSFLDNMFSPDFATCKFSLPRDAVEKFSS